jgi:hypothetical protein
MMPNSAIVAACKLAFTDFEKNDRSELWRLFCDRFFYGKEEFLAFWQQLVAKEWE